MIRQIRMTNRSIRLVPTVGTAILSIVLVTFLLEPWFSQQANLAGGGAVKDLFGLIESPETQWIAAAWLSFVVAIFVFVSDRKPVLDLVFFFVVLIHYVFRYGDCAASTTSLMLLGGVAIKCGVSALQINEDFRLTFFLSALYPVSVSMISLFAGDISDNDYTYYGANRLTGIWENPNYFGLLTSMALLVLAGLVLSMKRLPGVSKWVGWGVASVVGVSLASGLIYSFSRGAWLGTSVGTGFFLWQSHKERIRRYFSKAIVVVTILCSVVVLIGLMCQLRAAETPLIRRLGSYVNPYDFSKANRITSYLAAAKVIAARPVSGSGWQESLRHLDVYSPPNAKGGYAISTNSFLKLAMALGMPVLFLLCLIFAQSVIPHAETLDQLCNIRYGCRSAVLAGCVGFWLNGGLFTAPIWAALWMLLAFGDSAERRNHCVGAAVPNA